MAAPLDCDVSAFKRDFPALAGATALAFLLSTQGELGRLSGLLMIVCLAAYIVITYRSEKASWDAAARMRVGEVALAEPKPDSIWLSALLAAGGFGLLVLGADWMVSGSVFLARNWGISEVVIGSTVVALGTSLPELATTTMAAWRGHANVAVGNIIGSCIFNLFGILGATAIVAPVAVPSSIIAYDFWILSGVTALFIGLAVSGTRLSRWEGVVFLAGYVGYLSFLITRMTS